MNRTQLRGFVIVIAIALVGLIGIQIYWINNAFELEGDRIDRAATQALNEVVELLERHETLTKIRSHQQAKYLFFEEEGKEPTAFPPDDSLVQYVVKKNIQRVGDKIELKVEKEAGDQKEEKQFTHSVGDLPYSSDFEQDLELRLMTADSIDLELHHDNDPLAEDLTHIRERVENKKAFLGDIVKSLIEVNLDQPIDERIDPRILDSLMQIALKKHGLELTYLLGVFDQGGKMVLGSEDHEDQLRVSVSNAKLFPNDVIQLPYYLRIYFPNEYGYIFQSIWMMLLVSVILMIVLIWTSYSSVKTIFTQKKSSQIKNDFINNMTHELKTPISTISLACEALSDPEVGQMESVKNRYLGIINTENKRLGLLVEEVLQSAVLDKGDFKLKREDLEVNSLLQDVLDKFQIQVREKKGEVTFRASEDSLWVVADKNHLTNVIYNLLDNAAKYSRTKPRIDLRTEIIEDSLRVSVRDYGIGISAENLKKIFDRLYRVPTGNVHNVKGFGLGLSYVKIITERHGGRVYVESELGKGSTFFIELPLKQFEHGQSNKAA
ncbi:MAG: HAMP domain-containing histidine kinase [Flavobacteriales bacterium]|jgi:two-component system, OmpR family, phosphate regulon sensor histidine kinase PhoR|nr:HAMP domain-containing histidine kinase [Flavobacteriales bacterium]MBT4706251.1 HAMP domain-containing histidine kinase [Flavobacteriales bacterium]MBT4931426.1 HAMP domain-containing histidine kinase [Flavobacteriales bacterium]MBT5131538.1 HAMP domain-containing histidine kinase [Flavobacteriales bacterium]MBT6132332.1 HAMP domain-containing histidine kinase [Flavobacteriales bacterium]